MEFNLAQFRIFYTQFKDVTDGVVLAYSEMAKCYVSLNSCGCDQVMWQLMVSHLIALSQSNQPGGSGGGILSSATIDVTSISYQSAPIGNSAYKYWLNQTPYGTQLAALLSRCSTGGVYIGGRREGDAFRRVYGRFPRGRC